MQVVIFSSDFDIANLEYVRELFTRLQSHHIVSHVYHPFWAKFRPYMPSSMPIELFKGYENTDWSSIDYVITLGGDGTILRAVTAIKDSGVPIVGINLGRLGFLADIEKTRIPEAIECLINNNYRVEKRKLLQLNADVNLFGSNSFALNDFAIVKRDNSSMITVHVEINGQYLNSYWSDGVILSTPTGSTGYSLSCGGPVIYPGCGTFILTPISPHNLTIRPLVIPDDVTLSFEVEGRANHFLCTLDGRFATIESGQRIAVSKCDFEISLLKLPGHSFINTIRSKMGWGMDLRN